MASQLLAGLGLAGSLYGGFQQQKAAKATAAAIQYAADKQSSTMKEIARPWTEAAGFALPSLKDTIINSLMPQVGQEDPTLKGEHEVNLANIKRNTTRANADVDMFYGSTGNQGKARGEKLAISHNATDLTNNENLQYGKADRSYKDSRLSMLMDSLSGMANLGSNSISPLITGANSSYEGAVNSASVLGAAKQDFFGDMGTVFGMPIRDYLDERKMRRAAKLVVG